MVRVNSLPRRTVRACSLSRYAEMAYRVHGLYAGSRDAPRMSLRSLSVLCFLALVLVAGPAFASDYTWPVVRVVDGDTVAVDASADLPPELADLRVRLRGVDTPEKGGRAKCAHERRRIAVHVTDICASFSE